MRSVSVSSADTAPPIIFQTAAVRRRISASDSVALLLSELAFGPSRRSDTGTLHAVTANRCATCTGARS